MLAEKLNMTPEAAEKWIVNLIRNARLDAKIDSQLVNIFCFSTTDTTNYKLLFVLSPTSINYIVFLRGMS